MSADYYSSEDEYEEPDENIFTIKCLFCGENMTTHESICEHITIQHQVDFVKLCQEAGLDQFQFIKLVNYIRKFEVQPSELDSLLSTKKFDSEEFLKPTVEDDNFLMLDYDNDEEDESHKEEMSKDEALKGNVDYKVEYLKLKEQFERSHAEGLEMKQFIRDNIIGEDERGGDSKLEKPKVASLNENTDRGYIDSYSHFAIHHEMLSDKPRTEAYQDAIVENADYFRGKTVLDIGSGTGILAMFAAKSGASLVVAVDQSDIIYNALEIFRDNHLDGIIKTVRGKLEAIDFKSHGLPTQYDIIISEWMGYFLLYEGMVDTVLYARDHFLAPGGILLPNRCKLFMSTFSDSNYYVRNIDFWRDVYGFKMQSMVKNVIKEVSIDQVNSENICSHTPAVVAQLDMSRVSIEAVQHITSDFELVFTLNTTVHGFVGWFDCYFDALPKSVVLSTSPNAETTHWKQAIFPLEEPISVQRNDRIRGKIIVKRDQLRCLKVDLILDSHNLSLSYNIS